MHVELSLCFSLDIPQNDLYRELFDKYVRFEPEYTTSDGKVKAWNKQKHYPFLNEFDDHRLLSFSAANGMFFCTVVERKHSYRMIKILQEDSLFPPSSIDINEVAKKPGFIAGYLYNEDYEFVQSTAHDSNFEQRVIPVEIMATLKNTPYEIAFGYMKKYNTKFNPGRSATIDHFALQIGWKMWFGCEAFNFFSREKMLSFPYANDIQRLSESVVYIQLYEKIEEPYMPEAVFNQWKWRDWNDYDTIEEKYK